MAGIYIRQHHIVGIAQGVNNGDNFITYNYLNDANGTNAILPFKQAAELLHKDVKAHWKNNGTCEWLPRRPDFQAWASMKNPYSFLWLHGIQGCGKTTLMSRIIEGIRDERMTEQGPDAIHLLYFYIGYGKDEDKEKLYTKMLMTFWEQAVKQGELHASNIFDNRGGNEDIQNQLRRFLVTSERDVYIVIDGLDQLVEGDQTSVIEWINSVVQEHKDERNKFSLAVAVSSRDCVGYEELREHSPLQIQVKPSDNADDIQRYLEKTLKSRLFKEEPKLRTRVLSELTNSAGGMFLWAKLQAANICDMKLKKDVVHVLDNLILPTKMKKMYQKYATEFESLESPPTEKQIVMRAMALLAQTAGSMPKETFLVALTVNLNDGKPDEDTYQDLSEEPAKAVRLCKHLIEINESLGIVRFCHISVFEFFKDKNPIRDHTLIAELCLAHLCSSDFSQGPQSGVTWYNHSNLGPLLRQHPFLEFASCNWATSMKKSVEKSNNNNVDVEESHGQILDYLEELLRATGPMDEQENLLLSFQVHLLTQGIPMPTVIYHEHIVSYFSLLEFFDIFNRKGWLDLTRRDDEGLTAMHWAIRNKDSREIRKKEIAEVVGMLINYGGNRDARDKEGRTPLFYASYYDNPHAVNLLLGHKVKLDIPTSKGETALIIACRKHHEEIVLKLVAAGADIRIQGPVGTALQAISLIGCDGCAQSILDKYGTETIVESKGPFGTSLHAAAFHGHSKVVKLLCEKKLNIHATNETYGTALTAAAFGCNTGLDPNCFRETFQILIENGVNVNDPSGLCGPALRAAAHHGHVDLVRLLLDAGAKVRLAKGPKGSAAYDAADDRGHQEVKRLLLARDPSAAIHSEADPGKAFFAASQRIQREVFKITVKASNLVIIDGFVEQFEKIMEKEINKGNTPLFRGLLKMAVNCFVDVMQLETLINLKLEEQKKEEALNEQLIAKEKGEKAPPGEHAREASTVSKTMLKRLMASLCCVTPADEERETPNKPIPASQPKPLMSNPPVAPTPLVLEPNPQLGEGMHKRPKLMHRVARRTSSLTFSLGSTPSTTRGRNNLEGHFPQVLDRLTVASVRILECAIWKGDVDVIDMIAERWVAVLNDLVSLEGLGEPMLERLIQNRADELHKQLLNEDLDFDQRVRKAEGLARVGGELLFTAVGRELREESERGKRPSEKTEKPEASPLKRLIYVLSRLFISAMFNVGNLGDRGQEPVAKIIQNFGQKFSDLIKERDRAGAWLVGRASLELMRASAWSPNQELTKTFCRELVRHWRIAEEAQMGSILVDLFHERWEEYQALVINKQNDDALGFAVASVLLLQAAIEEKFDVMRRWLLDVVNLGFRWSLAPDTLGEAEQQQVKQKSNGGGSSMEVKRGSLVFEAIVMLFATVQGDSPGSLHDLALTILDVLEALPKDSQQALTELIQQRIQHTRRGVHAAELELQLRQISITIHYLYGVARVDNRVRPNVISALEAFAQTVPNVTASSGHIQIEP